MSGRYIISDLHLSHKNISNFRDNGLTSEEQWDKAYEGLTIANKRDILFLLGDIAFSKYWLDKIKELPCQNKILIVGNHCLQGGITMRDLVDTYEQVYSLHKYKGFWLSHAPIHPMELRGKRNIQGHTHPYLMTKEVYGETVVDDRYINVCVEYVGYTPIKWEYAISEEYKQECLIKYKQFILEGKIKP